MSVFVEMGTSFVNLPLFFIFWFADLFYAPQLKWHFLALRSLTIPAAFLARFIIKKFGETLFIVQIAASLVPVTNSLVITTMIFVTEGLISPYYAGLNLGCSGILSLVPWTTRFMVFNVIILYAPYYLLGAILTPEILWHPTFIIYTFFVGGTIATTTGIRMINEQLRRRELTARARLSEELTAREEIIREKTQESVKLAQLSSQFSPQVVHSIRRGEIKLDAGVHRAKICAIFVDAVGSTERVSRVDNADMHKVISMFLEDTVKVLLKYDITVDKFLGDGVLAFSNDPIKRDDYIERVLRAALEIKKEIASHSEVYQDLWLRPFDIRIGIAHGYASVGFYGNEKYFRTYTAIGPVVNLANRLCGIAEPNQVVVARDVVRAVPEDYFEFKELDPKLLRGFEGDIIRIYQLLLAKDQENRPTGVAECPRCQKILHLETINGLFFFKCRNCDYILEHDQALTEKATTKKKVA